MLYFGKQAGLIKRNILSKTEQEKGRQFESEFASEFGGKLQPGSGNTPFYKLDVEGKAVLNSLKYTAEKNKSIRILQSDLDEVNEAVYGIGGLGGEFTPALSFKLGGETYTLIKTHDLVKLLQQNIEIFAPPKNSERKAKANTTALDRRQEKVDQ